MGSENKVVGERNNKTAYWFILPSLAFLTCFMFGPLIKEIWISFTDTKLMSPNENKFIGLENYVNLVKGGDLWKSIVVTFCYTILVLIISVFWGLMSALLINKPFFLRSFVRTVFLFGYAVPGVASALIWAWIYDGKSGAINIALEWFGINGVSWLSDTRTALIAVVFATVWEITPFVMLVLLASLQSVSQELEEAGKIDGADNTNIFHYIVFPAIRPSIGLVSLLVAIWTIRRFDLIFLLTGGGPLNSTSTIIIALRNTAFENMDLGGAAAYGVIGLMMALAVGLIQRIFEHKYE